MSTLLNIAVQNNLKRLYSFLDGWALVLLPRQDSSNEAANFLYLLKESCTKNNIPFKRYSSWKGEDHCVLWTNPTSQIDISKIEKFNKNKVILLVTYEQYTQLLNTLPPELYWLSTTNFGTETRDFCLTNL